MRSFDQEIKFITINQETLNSLVSKMPNLSKEVQDALALVIIAYTNQVISWIQKKMEKIN